MKAGLVIATGLFAVLIGVGIFVAMPWFVDPIANRSVKSHGETHVKVKLINRKGQLVGPVEVERVSKTDAEWRAQLTPMQYAVARGKGTERAFCGTLLDNKKTGIYACICCKLPLFASNAKFNSGTGWPSFFQAVSEENVATQIDRDGMRAEILCARCDCHLGHVFDDGPPPTGRRHCVNSESLVFVDQADLASLADPAADSVQGESAP